MRAAVPTDPPEERSAPAGEGKTAAIVVAVVLVLIVVAGLVAIAAGY